MFVYHTREVRFCVHSMFCRKYAPHDIPNSVYLYIYYIIYIIIQIYEYYEVHSYACHVKILFICIQCFFTCFIFYLSLYIQRYLTK